MAFAESIACKRFNLPPHFFCYLIGMSFLAATIEKSIFHFFKLCTSPIFSTHASAQHVGFCECKSGKIMCYLNHIFLIYHHPTLRNQGYDDAHLRFVLTPDAGHNEDAWALRLPEAMAFLFGDWKAP